MMAPRTIRVFGCLGALAVLLIGWKVSPAAEFYRSVLIGLAVAAPSGVATALEERRPWKPPFSGLVSVLILLIPGWIFIGMGTTPFWAIMSYAATVILFGEIPCWLVRRYFGMRKSVQPSAL